MFRSLMSSVSNTAATSSSSHNNDGNGNDHKKNETQHLSNDMKSNEKIDDVVGVVVETIDNDDDDSGVMLEARTYANGDGRYYQEQDIRNNNDEQELLLVGKILSYDNIMTAPNSNNSQHYDDPSSLSVKSVKSESSSRCVTPPVTEVLSQKNNHDYDDYDHVKSPPSVITTTTMTHMAKTGMEDDDQLSFHPDEVNSSSLLAEFGGDSPMSFGNKFNNMIHSSDPLLWDNESSRFPSSRHHHQNGVEEITSVLLPDAINSMNNILKMEDVTSMTTVEHLMMKREEENDSEQQNQERNVLSDHQHQPSVPSSHHPNVNNIEVIVERMKMMTMINNKKKEKMMKNNDGIMNNNTNHQQGQKHVVEHGQEILVPKNTKKNQWSVIPTLSSDEPCWYITLCAYMIIIIAVVGVISCFIIEVSKQKTLMKTMSSPLLSNVEDITSLTSTITMNASIFQSDNSVVIPAAVIKNNELNYQMMKSMIWSDVTVAFEKQPSSSSSSSSTSNNNKIESTTIFIPITASSITDNSNTTTVATTVIKDYTTAATTTRSNDHHEHVKQSKQQSQPPHHNSNSVWWLPKSVSNFINYLWMKLIQLSVFFGMVLLAYKFSNWHSCTSAIKSNSTDTTVATTNTTQPDNMVSDGNNARIVSNSIIVSNTPVRPEEQNQRIINRVYCFHKYDELFEFMKQSNALLQRNGHTPKKSCTLQSCTLQKFVNRGIHINDLNITSYNRLSKDELILLIEYFDNHHGNNTIMMSPSKRSETKAILQLKLITCYHEVLVTLSNEKLNELIIVKLQNRNVDNGTRSNIRKLSSIVLNSPPTIRPPDVIMSSSNSTVITNNSSGENNNTQPDAIMSSPPPTTTPAVRRSRLSINIDNRNEMIHQLLEMGF